MLSLSYRRPVTLSPADGARIAPMGLNPYRARRRRPTDAILVAAALVVTLLLVVWALGLT